jgi:hypothetical protein
MTRNAVTAIMSAIIIMGISSSRVSLRAHHAVDVVLGAFIGCALGCASYLALRYHSNRRSFVGYNVNVGIAVVLSAYSIIALRARLNSSTVLLGLGLAALTALPVLKFVERVKPLILTRVLACVISITSLLGSHTMTRGYAPYIRLMCFYVVGLCIFSMAWLFKLFLRGWGQTIDMGYVQGVLRDLALNVPKGQVGTLKRVKDDISLDNKSVKVVSKKR